MELIDPRDGEEQSLFPHDPAAKPIQQRLVTSALEIHQDRATIDKADFLHAILCQVGIPRSNNSEREFERKSGTASMKLIAGELWDGQNWIPQPLPYGSSPRLAMVNISSEAVRTKDPHIDIGSSMHQYMKRLGIDTNGRAYRNFSKQMNALAACTLNIGWVEGGQPRSLKAPPIKSYNAWHSIHEETPGLWPGEIVLTEDFFTTLCTHAVPLDTRAIAALKHSAMCLDIYTWMAYRLCQLKKPTPVSWKALKGQFGDEYLDEKNFKRNFKKSLAQVLSQYPNAKIRSVTGGLELLPSLPPIPKRIHQVVQVLENGSKQVLQ